jgi:hypothetical protein
MRSVFFSFHYEADIWRVSQVRNCRSAGTWHSNTFLDAASWESVRRRGKRAITEWIDRQLEGTSVTVVLIGRETVRRTYVQYEIVESLRRGNGLLGIHVHQIKDHAGRISRRGRNPLRDHSLVVRDELFGWLGWTERKSASDVYKTYDWVADSGYEHIHSWIEDAARRAGR